MKKRHSLTGLISENPLLVVIAIVMFYCFNFTNNPVSAQDKPVATQQPAKANFYEIQKRFNDSWKGRKVTRGSGYKPFKRWEWYWEARVNRDGTFPPNNVVVKEWEKYCAENTYDAASAAGNWVPLGPSKPANRYFGAGRINCIAFHPTDANTFWVGTPAGGLWKTTDFGKTWTSNPAMESQPSLGVSDMVIDPNDPRIMYIATGDGDAAGMVNLINGSGDGDNKSIGILKSIDGGLSWQKTGLNWELKDQSLIARLIRHPASSDTLFAATSGGIYKTINKGDNWNAVTSVLNFSDIAFNPGNPRIMYASTRSAYITGSANPEKYRSGQIYRSTNGGATWDSVTRFSNVTRIKLAVTPQKTDLVEAVCVSEQQLRGLKAIYRFKDTGNEFKLTDTIVKLYKNCSNNYLNSAHDPEMHDDSCKGQGDYDLCYLINPLNVNERWLGGVNTYKSSDGGKEFRLVNYWADSVANIVEQVHADKHWFAFHPLKPGIFFECNDGGIYYTDNGGKRWKDISAGLQISQIYRIGSSYIEPDVVIAGFQDNGSQVRTDSSNTNKWVTPDIIGGDGMGCIIDWIDPGVMYASYSYGVIKRTTDGTWSRGNTKIITDFLMKEKNQTGAWVTPYVIHPKSPKTLYVGYRNIWRTTDRGDKWDSISNLPRTDNDKLLNTLAISESDPKVMWVSAGEKLYNTTDEWKNFKLISFKPLPANENMITGIAIHPTKPETVFITFSGYKSQQVYCTVNGGESWTNISGTGLPQLPVNCIAYEEDTKDALYIGTDAGVFYKDSQMTEWIPFNKNMPNVMISDLSIEYGTGKIRAATYGRGLWESDLYVATGFNKVNEQEIPKDGGIATGGGVYPTGSTVNMIATPTKKSNTFLGWYENGVKVHDSTTFTFVVQNNRNLIAKFENPSGLEDNLKSRIQLFPNPTKGVVEVRLDKGLGDDLQKIIVTSMQGKSVYESAAKAENDHFLLDLSANPQGNYVITLYFKSGEKVSYSLLITR